MANLSDASVDIVAHKVGAELLEYINTVNKTHTDYPIVYDGFDEHVNANGDTVVNGSAAGRWSYENNLEGYFDAEKVRNWLGVGHEFDYVKDDKERQQYLTSSEEQYKAYNKLMEALKDTNGSIEISYTDCDPAMDWQGQGSMTLTVEDDTVVYGHYFDSEEMNITKYADISGLTLSEAFDILHGEEPAAAWLKYEQECKDKGVEPKDPQVWYDEDFEWE